MRNVVQTVNDGITLSGPIYIYGYHMSIIHNTEIQKSILEKKCNSLYYHVVRNFVSMGESQTGQMSVNFEANSTHRITF